MRHLLRTHWRYLTLLALLAALPLLLTLPVASGQAIGGADMRGLFYPWLEFAHNAVWRGELPLWDPDHFGGYPFLANPQVAFFYPPTWFALVFQVNVGILLYLWLHLWLAGAGMFLFVRNQSHGALSPLGQAGALLAAVSFVYSGFFAARIFAGHIGLLAVHVWVAWLLLTTDQMLRRPVWRAAVPAAVTFGLAVLAGHTTSLIYLAILWGGYALFQAMQLRVNLLILLRQMLLAGIGGLLLASVQFLPLVELAGLAARSAETNYDFAARFSLPVQQIITLALPNHFGEPAQIGYWGAENYAELAAYAGVLPLILLLLALAKPTKRLVFWLLLIVVGILIAIGSNGFLHPLLFELPIFGLTRAPGRALFFVLFGLCALAGETVQSLKDWRRVRLLLGVAAFVSLLPIAWSLLSSVPSVDGDAYNRLRVQQATALRTGLIACVIAGMLWVGLRPKWQKLAVAVLFGLVLFDLGSAHRPLVRQESIVPAAFWTGAQQLILSDQPDFDGRILPWGVNIFDQNNPAQVGLSSVFGYNVLELASNRALYLAATDPRSEIYDRFAARYTISQTPLEQFTSGDNGLQFVGEQDGAFVYRRPQSQPLVFVASAQEQMAVCGTVPLLDAKMLSAVTRSGSDWAIDINVNSPALVVTSEVAYPGWRASLDGAASEWHPVLGGFRGVCVEAGEQVLTWVFRPNIFLYGGLISLLTLLGCIWAIRTDRSHA